MTKDIYIIDGLRTPIGGAHKSMRDISPIRLGGTVIKSILQKNRVAGHAIDEVILGNAVGAGLGQNPARQALINAGLPVEVPAFTVGKVCGAGLKAVMLGAQAISCGDADLILAGGMESASQCPYVIPRNRAPLSIDQSEKDNHDSLIKDGLWCNMSDDHMGELAEYTAETYKVTREAQDKFALNSHKKACHARNGGIFSGEIVPVETDGAVALDIDEKPRENVSMERLARIPAAFKAGGTVTAGNSCAPADGAAVVMLASGEALKEAGVAPIARILGYSTVSADPKSVFTVSAPAIERCLKSSSLRMSDVDLFEINEAFSVQVLVTLGLIGLEAERVNIFGGDIALGHPLGAAGVRALVTLLTALRHRNKKIGVTSICLGGGGALALAVEIFQR